MNNRKDGMNMSEIEIQKTLLSGRRRQSVRILIFFAFAARTLRRKGRPNPRFGKSPGKFALEKVGSGSVKNVPDTTLVPRIDALLISKKV
jgi:hypothetical protein